ncbi:type II CAAX prenyl endopeptidase Rce1 family protein [Pendulispora albinea]|uniref:CPBP family glutamic-type intramembrane protease n=1 Tax=Pendulispora albinea TaxID=2741071 RepID=A0ABZ2LXV0_9BACT
MASSEAKALAEKPGAWIDLALTLPIFLAYHAGVVFLKIQNATDVVTPTLVQLAEGNRAIYLLITAAIGVVFAGIFAWLGRGQAFRTGKFIQVIVEGALYAVVMRVAGSYAVTELLQVVTPSASLFGLITENRRFVGAITSLGAGFYEELAFRVVLFGLGAKLLVWFFTRQEVQLVKQGGARLSLRAAVIMFVWMLVAAAIFSGVHYTGAMADKFLLTSFIYRMVIGVVLTLIYLTRGFSTAVWAHALYDIWVLVF